MSEHDPNCVGCETSREAQESGGVFVRDYLAHCDDCGASIQGDTQHYIGGRELCRSCAFREPTTPDTEKQKG